MKYFDKRSMNLKNKQLSHEDDVRDVKIKEDPKHRFVNKVNGVPDADILHGRRSTPKYEPIVSKNITYKTDGMKHLNDKLRKMKVNDLPDDSVFRGNGFKGSGFASIKPIVPINKIQKHNKPAKKYNNLRFEL